jgi:hypothetical protein
VRSSTAWWPGIAVSFKLDPQLTSRAPKGKEITVEARAEGSDAKGGTTKI